MSEEQTLREKNKQAAVKQKELRSVAKKESAMERVSHLDGLTKRNEEYMYNLMKALDGINYDPEKKAAIVQEMVTELKEKQKQGITANKLYGTVKERIEMIQNGPKIEKEKQSQSFWVVALDNFLMMMILFSVMYGILGFFDLGQAASGGIVTLVLVAVVTGLSLAYFYKVSAKRKKDWVRIVITMIEIVAAWLLTFGLISYIPDSINIVLNHYVYLVLGIALFGVRYYLKDRLGFKRFPL
ncbi:DUF1129 family protein [Ligilactobacillus ceti]|uniref:Putative membrane spanning protein n=1 Tax=Ligilactobacillus ceti DSM 22408 TaxID=1122146 RepID=A0A0R2KJK0_9LACO|nr:DUF1129 family protein [Ligilactobacillus ceti]KRN89553.1 putative membrane spanning protein [Ligilactobacillus ceti DSM 22408]